MSVASLGSIPLSTNPTPTQAIGSQQAVFQNSVSNYLIKDQIKLSEKAISLLGGTPPAAK